MNKGGDNYIINPTMPGISVLVAKWEDDVFAVSLG